MLARPLLPSSSVRLLPPVDSLDFRCPKLLLYLVGGPGLGELEVDNGIPCSAALSEPRGTEPYGLRLVGARASANAANGEDFPSDPRGPEVIIFSACEGDADKDGLLKG